MSDLKTRIGPKVGQDLFPNKAWVQPGYELKPRSQWHHRRPSEGYGSDVSEHEGDSPGRTPKSNRTASLLTRMGLESPDREEEGKRNMTPSLLERVGGIEPENRQRSDDSVSRSVSVLGERQQTPSKTSYAGEGIQSQAQGPSIDPKTRPANNGADLPNRPVTTENNKTSFNLNNHRLTSQSSGSDCIREDRVDAAQHGDVSTERISDNSSSFRHSTSGPSAQQAPNPVSASAIPNHRQPNATATSSSSVQKTLSQQTLSEDGELPNHIPAHQGTPEEGEVQPESLPAEKVRGLVVPLLLRIAAKRMTDTEQVTVSSQSPPAMNTTALTDEVLSSFAAKGATEVRREMRARERESSNGAWIPQPNTSTSRPDTPLATSTAGPSLVTSRKDTGPSNLHPTANMHDTSHISTYDKTEAHNPPQRDHPSSKPSEFEQAHSASHINDPYSSKATETRIEPRVKRPRSPSPHPAPQQRYARRRSSSREEGPSAYERPLHQSEYESRSTHAYGHTQTTYDRPHHISGPPPHSAPTQVHRSTPLRYSPRKHTPPLVSRSIYAERMAGRSSSPVGRGAGREGRSPIRGREIHSPPMSPTRVAYAPRPYNERDEGHQRAYSAHYSSSEHRDTRYRKPYEPSSVDRRRSRSPPRRPSTAEQQIPLSPRRRSRDRMDVDHDYRSKSLSNESRHDYTSSPQRRESWQIDPPPESPISRALSAQPQANAPFRSAKPGLDHLGILKWTFELDQQTVTRLNLDKLENNARFTENASTQKPTSLKLACYPKDQFIRLVEKANIGQPPTPETSAISHAWPKRGHLIIKMNEEVLDFRGKTWLPDKLDPKDPPIVLDCFVRQGQNVIELIQLSSMADKVFWISEQEKADTTGILSVDDHGFAPLANSRTLSELIPITPADVTISEILS